MDGRTRDIEQRMALAFDLWETGDQIMLQNLRRRNPEASEEEIAELFQQWLLVRPGAEHGDASGDDFRVREIDL